MHPEILGEIADARLADRRREAAVARRALAVRRAAAARRDVAGNDAIESGVRALRTWVSSRLGAPARHPLRRGLRGAR